MDIDYSVNSELKKLQFFGAGPKAAVPQGGEVKGERAKIMIGSKVMQWIFFYPLLVVSLLLIRQNEFEAHACHVVFSEENTAEIVENGGGVSTRHKNPGPGAYTTVSLAWRGDKYIVCVRGDWIATENVIQCTRESA